MSDGSEGAETRTLVKVDERMARLRGNDRQRRVALAGAVVLGLALSTLHWVGLFVAGALVGLTRRNLPRALVAGLAFGLLILAVFFVVTPLIVPRNVLVLAPLSTLTLGLALVGPVWGAMVRGVV